MIKKQLLKFGYLTLIFKNKKQKKSLYKCICGKIKYINRYHVSKGNIISCGCFALKQRTKHGNYKNPFYKTWQLLKHRCNNITSQRYSNYEKRGISYDPRWNDFLEFKKDMYIEYVKCRLKYKGEKLSIERKNVNGNYNKENCTFIPKSYQARNTRKVKPFYAINTKTNKKVYFNIIRDFSRKYNIDNSTISKCLRGIVSNKQTRGWEFHYSNSEKG